MTQKLDEMLAGLQNQVIEQVGRPSGPELLLPRQQWKFMGRMTNASCTGKLTGKCGETIEIYLRIEGECIREANFYTNGCGASKACGSMAVKLATGKDIDEAALIGGDTILEALKDLPECHRHCAYLAAETLQAAIHDWMVRERVGTRNPEGECGDSLPFRKDKQKSHQRGGPVGSSM